MSRLKFWSTLALLLAATAGAQQVNTPTASMIIDTTPQADLDKDDVPIVSPADVVGLGPLSADLVMDSPFTIKMQSGQPGMRYIIIGGVFQALWFQHAPQVYIDIKHASAASVIVNGFRPGEMRYMTGAESQGSLTFVLTDSMTTVGATGAIQMLVEDPTSPFGLRTTAASRFSVMAAESPDSGVSVGDSEVLPVVLQPGFQFPFFGNLYDKLFVTDDGFIGFDKPDSMTPGIHNFKSNVPGIAAFFADLDPTWATDDGSITVEQYRTKDSWRVEITYTDLPLKADLSVRVSVKVTLYDTGVIELRWPALAAIRHDVIVGVTPGYDVDSDSTSMDLTGAKNTLQPYSPLRSVFESFNSGNGLFDLGGKTISMIPTWSSQHTLSYSVF